MPPGITIVSAFASSMMGITTPVCVRSPSYFPYKMGVGEQVSFALNNSTVGNLTTLIMYTIYAHA
jgi:hypothetical protein